MKVAIVGAGITGLTLGFDLQKVADVTVFERSERSGGLICSKKVRNFLFEMGPHSFRSAGKGESTLQLIKDLDLCDQLLPPSPKFTTRYLLKKGNLQPLQPLRYAGSVIKDLFSLKGKEEESIAEFTKRRFGKKFLDNLFDPLVTGIWAGDPQQLSLDFCFPNLREHEQKWGSVFLGALMEKIYGAQQNSHPIFSLQGGMQTITDELAQRVVVQYGCEITDIAQDREQRLWLQGDEKYGPFDRVYITVPWGKRCPRASVAVVHLAWEQPLLEYQGFGYLVPSKEKEAILGVIFDSTVFPSLQPKDSTVLTVMMGGMRNPLVMKNSDQELIKTAVDAVKRHLHIEQTPVCTHVWKGQECIPQYPVGYQDDLRAERMQAPKKVEFLGCERSGVAINDCIASARQAAKQVTVCVTG